MALFQKTVISKYLQTQPPENLIIKWDLFRAYFHNPIIQENIRNSKEEQYQEGFLRDLFVTILGYQLNPAHNFNLTTEYKNIRDSKKADGAIIIQRSCERKFENLNLNKKLQDWYNLSYGDFIKELSKQKIKLTLSEEAEWADYFDQEKSKALEIQTKIASTDNEIDQMVYELYGLSEEEIKIVED